MKKNSLVLILLLLGSSFLLFPTIPAHALSSLVQVNSNMDTAACGAGASTCSLAFSFSITSGNFIGVTIATNAWNNSISQSPWDCPPSSNAVTSVTDGRSTSFFAASISPCNHNFGEMAAIYYGFAGGSGADTVTVHFIGSPTASMTEYFSIYEVSGIVPPAIAATGAASGGCVAACIVGPGAMYFAGDAFSLAAAMFVGQAVTGVAPGYSSPSLNCNSFLGGSGCDEYAASASLSSPTSPSFTTNGIGGTTYFAMAGVVFGLPSGPNKFDCAITNMDAGDYLIAGNGKFYDFRCSVQSSAISISNSPVVDIRMVFNDSVHLVQAEWYVSPVDGSQHYRLLNGSSSAVFSGGTTTQTTVGGVQTTIVNFLISLTQNAVDSADRGLYLFAVNQGALQRGFEYLGNSFNIMNKGGVLEVQSSGLCSIPPGADNFQTKCKYQASPASWIRENVTYFNLQQFQAQDMLKLSDGNSLTVPVAGDSTLWGTYPISGPNSTNPGDWKISYGLYYFDNASGFWVKGLTATITTYEGIQSSANEWARFNVEWTNGNTFIKNETITDWIQQDPLAGATIYINLWFSNNNASTVQGGQVSTYYTGMHNSGFLWWTSWSPTLQNDTATEAFAPILDHNGNLASSTALQFTKIGYNMTRPGVPAVHSNQPNFYLETMPYVTQNFGIASASMGGISNPSFTAAVVPIIQNTGFFSPIINALKTLAGWIVSALSYAGTQAWNAIGSRFPWFTGFFDQAAGLLVSTWLILSQVLGDVVGFISFLPSLLSPLTAILNIIGGAWGFIQSSYNTVFGGANLSAMITIMAIFFFCSWFFATLESKNPVKGLVKMASSAWRVVFALLNIMWMLAKFIVDAVEGLIP